MEQVTALLIPVLVSLTFSTIVTVVISAPLRTTLRHLCLDADASAFWAPFTSVMLYVTPLLFTVHYANLYSPNLGNTLQTALSTSLLGGFAALLVVGIQISKARPVR